jgi:hypothetical protein
MMILSTSHVPAAEQIRVEILCAAMNCCSAQLRNLIRKGAAPAADFYQHGQASYWSLETIRTWNPAIARRCVAIKAITQIAA